MRRNMKWTVGLLALLGVGLLAGAFIPSGLATTASSHAKTVKHRKHVKAVKVTVVAKEWSFKLSKGTVPAGSTVAFKVVNKGKIGHDFKIAGKKTKLLAPGKSQTITVKFSKKKKRYAYGRWIRTLATR